MSDHPCRGWTKSVARCRLGWREPIYDGRKSRSKYAMRGVYISPDGCWYISRAKVDLVYRSRPRERGSQFESEIEPDGVLAMYWLGGCRAGRVRLIMDPIRPGEGAP